MSDNILDGEIDRHLILKHEKQTFGKNKYEDIVTAKVGKKKFSFTARYKGDIIEFQKISDDSLDITLKTKRETTQRCSLGHEHVIDSKETNYHWFTLPSDHVDSFVDWIKTGTWNEVSKRQPTYKTLLKNIKLFLQQIPKDSIFRANAVKLVHSIDIETRDHIQDLREVK